MSPSSWNKTKLQVYHPLTAYHHLRPSAENLSSLGNKSTQIQKPVSWLLIAQHTPLVDSATMGDAWGASALTGHMQLSCVASSALTAWTGLDWRRRQANEQTRKTPTPSGGGMGVYLGDIVTGLTRVCLIHLWSLRLSVCIGR